VAARLLGADGAVRSIVHVAEAGDRSVRQPAVPEKVANRRSSRRSSSG
jgi:hypothetical protein